MSFLRPVRSKLDKLKTKFHIWEGVKHSHSKENERRRKQMEKKGIKTVTPITGYGNEGLSTGSV